MTMHNGPDADGRCAPARLDGFGFDLPPHFGHCGSLFATLARTNAHPTPLLSVQTQIRHSVHGGHILTMFGKNALDSRVPLKRLPLLIGSGIVCMGIGLSLYLAAKKTAIIYLASGTPTGWVRHSNEEEGFEVSLPADWNSNQSLGIVSFSAPNYISFGVQRIALPIDTFWEETRLGRYLPKDVSRHKAIVAGLSGEQANYRTGNFTGSWPVESFVFSRGPVTYLVSWSASRDKLKARPEDRDLCHSVLTTFRFIERRQSDSLRYRDPAERFTFEVPSDWLVSGGAMTGANVTHGSDTWISINVYDQTTSDQFRQRHGITQSVPKAEWFAHHLPGWRISLNGRDTYVFDRGSDLVVIEILRSAEPTESMMRFFDSFSISAGKP